MIPQLCNSRNIRRLVAITGALCLLLPFGPGSRLAAATTIYTNGADFVTAIGILPMSLNEFTNQDEVGWLAHPIHSSLNGISYSITTQPALRLVGFEGAFSARDTSDEIVATFTSGNVTGVGGYFYPADTNAAPISGSVTVSVSDGTVTNLTILAGAPLPFLGFLSDGPLFTSVTVTNTSGIGYPALAHFYVIDGIPSPTITLTGANGLLISWYAAPTGFVLQASSNPYALTWTNVEVKPQEINTQFQVSLPLSGPAGFFRLKK
jgi:hypothetical protein